MRVILFLGGVAALGWQIVWSHHLGLALGASARGVALTVATAMAGMTLGALFCARLLRDRRSVDPLFLYGALELVIGLCALVPGVAEAGIMELDGILHRRWPWAATPFTVAALATSIGPACLAMGATIPAMGLVAQTLARPLSRLYACNTAGAAAGTLLAAFFLIPELGLRGSSAVLVVTHLSLGLACFLLAKSRRTRPETEQPAPHRPIQAGTEETRHAPVLVFLSGLSAFLLEVSWFRSLRSAWFSTADSLAVMLFCFLVALAFGAALAPAWRRRGLPLWAAFAGAAVLVLVSTSMIGRFDLVEAFQERGAGRQVSRLLAGLAVIGPPVVLLGLALPFLLDGARTPREWARLYAVNTLGAVIGSNLAAWLFLERLGPGGTSWAAGTLLALGAWFSAATWNPRASAAACFALVLAAVAWFDRGEGRRVPRVASGDSEGLELIERRHGPDTTISVVAYPGGRALFLNGFATTAEAVGSPDPRFRYMESIGRLPMLLHPAPRDALVICFGTGQTAHAVRDEGPEHLDLVDLNAAVFDLGRHFASNHRVLEDPRVRKIVMDGRAWLRRTDRSYDVVTLEPMPPFFSGSNALYSVGFYELVHARLRPGGFLAQWFPLHLMTLEQAESVAAAFSEVFPDAVLWMDPASVEISGLPDQGILLGRRPVTGGSAPDPFWEQWPGYTRPAESGARSPSAFEAKSQVLLDPEDLRRFASGAEPVTDDNQLLEYGVSPYRVGKKRVADSIREIHARIEAARTDAAR